MDIANLTIKTVAHDPMELKAIINDLGRVVDEADVYISDVNIEVEYLSEAVVDSEGEEDEPPKGKSLLEKVVDPYLE